MASSATVGGKIATAGDAVPAIEVEGTIDSLSVGGGIAATGAGADGVHIAGEPAVLDGITITATGPKIVTA